MATQIVKINKSMSLIDTEDVEMFDAMTIDHFSDVIKTSQGEIEFIISSTNYQIPEIDEIEYAVVIREKVDLSSHGPNAASIKEKDIKAKNFKDHKACVPTDLPSGFIQLKGE